MGKHTGYALAAAIVGLAVLGARLPSNFPLYVMLGLIVFALLLVTFDRIKEKQYSVVIFAMSLGLVYQLTLQSNYVVGTDIHYEYYFALQTYNNGYWDYTIGHSYNAATAISVFVPMLARLLHIPLAWTFKVVPPLFLAAIPVVTYHIFRKEFDSKTAFLATFFFISVPTMFLELSGIAKQSIGELFLVSCLGLVAYNVLNLHVARYVLIALFGILAGLSHYTMGGTLVCYLLGSIVLLAAGRYILKLKLPVSLPGLAATIMVCIAIMGLFYSWAAKGAPLQDILLSSGMTSGLISRPSAGLTPEDVPLMPNTSQPTAGSSRYDHWQYPEPAVAVALGADFAEVNAVSKVFRIFQYATQLLVIVGGIAILIHYRRRSLGYLALFALSGVIMGLVIFYPGFSPLLNATRFYNLALLFMAPALVVGGKLILRSYKTVALAILIPYFIFTSGVMFEAARISDLTSITVPYSHALSGQRIDSTALLTANDVAARDWVKSHNAFPVYGDMWGATAMFEVQSNLSEGTNEMLSPDKTYVNVLIFREDAEKPELVPDNSYILLRERNVERSELTYQTGVGLRRTRTFTDAQFYNVLEGRRIVFRSGDARVYGPKGEG